MISSLHTKILEKRVWVFLSVFLLIFFGIKALGDIPIDAVPDITNIQVLVNTKTGGLDPEQVEKTITYNIENNMAGLPRVKDIRSLSKFGLSQVVVVFEDGVDIYMARQLVSERLQSVIGELPEGAIPQLGPMSTGLSEVFMYVVLPKEGSPLAKKPKKERLLYLRTIHDFLVKPYLKAYVEGVADVDTNGGYKKEIHIDFHPKKLEQYAVSLKDLHYQLENIGESFGGGYLERNNEQVIIRTKGEMGLDALKKMPIKLGVLGNTIRLSQVADVRSDHAQRVGAATYRGEEAVLGTILMLSGENSREVATQAEKALSEIQLPADVTTKILYTRTFLVDETLKTVAKNLTEGALLVIAILFLIMGNIRAAMIVVLAIPLSMLGAFIGMREFGISANLMSLGAIDFGLLVDGSVVMIENLIRKLNESGNTLSPKQKISLVVESTKEVRQPVILGLLIIMIVYIPILSLEGVEGKMFRPMALTVLMALGVSLLVAILLMPLLGYLFLLRSGSSSKHKISKDTILFRLIQKGYRSALNFTLEESLKNRVIILSAVSLLLVTAVLAFIRIGSDFLPPLNEGDMVVNFTHPSEISLSSSLEYQFDAEKEIQKFGEVKHVFSRIGTPESATDPMGVNLVDTFLILYDSVEWPMEKSKGRRRLKKELYRDLEKKLTPMMGKAEISENQPIEMRFNEMLEGSRADISLRIYGKDLKILITLQNKTIKILETIDGVGEVELDALTSLKKSNVLELELDFKRMNAYRISANEVNHTFETAMSGAVVGSYYEYDWRFPIILKMAEEYRNDYNEIRRIPIALPEPGSIPLSNISRFRKVEDIVAIARANGKRYAGIAINLDERDTLSFVKEAKEKLGEKLKLSEGYEIRWGGQFKNLERAIKKLSIIIPIVLIVIFILIYQNFNSFRHTILIYLSIPFAAVGGIFALYLRGLILSVSAWVGFITLAGIAILNGMVLITFINQLREEGKSLKEAVTQGALVRLRPVIMTALVASLGFLPMAINTGIGAELQKPLATVVIGGLASSTILTLLLLPTFYYWLGDE